MLSRIINQRPPPHTWKALGMREPRKKLQMKTGEAKRTSECRCAVLNCAKSRGKGSCFKLIVQVYWSLSVKWKKKKNKNKKTDFYVIRVN